MSKNNETPPIIVDDRINRYDFSSKNAGLDIKKLILAVGDAISDSYGQKLLPHEVNDIRRIFFDDGLSLKETERLFAERYPALPGLNGVLVKYLKRVLSGEKGNNN